MDCSESSFRARGLPQLREMLLPGSPLAVLSSLLPFATSTDLQDIQRGVSSVRASQRSL